MWEYREIVMLTSIETERYVCVRVHRERGFCAIWEANSRQEASRIHLHKAKVVESDLGGLKQASL